MTRNQKIALGCGGAGCLGLIVVVIAAGLIFYFAQSNSTNRDFDITTNRNSNSNDDTINSNDNDNSSSSSSSSSSAASSLSDDEKHKLYQAAGMTGDAVVMRRVSVKLGLMNDDYTPGDNFRQFVIEHASWAVDNQEFIQSINTEEKAREYLNENLPE